MGKLPTVPEVVYPPLPLDPRDQRRIVILGTIDTGGYPACSHPFRKEIISRLAGWQFMDY